MVLFKKFGFKGFMSIFTATTILWFAGCAFPTRTGYDRKIGGYKPASNQAPQNSTPTTQVSTAAPKKNSVEKQREAIRQKEIAKAAAKKEAPKGGLENYAKGWLGAKYVYGAASRTKTDCSGFIMQVYKGYYNISMDHNAAGMYKDSRGKSISRGNLKEGDLVFFGSLWKIDHVGIYLSGERFIHASTSKGVIISPMSDKYWSKKYQGARRYR